MRLRAEQIQAEGVPALRRLIEVANHSSGQSRTVRSFLLGLYNGQEWPFDLTRLRTLDADLKTDALWVLHLSLNPRKEIHDHIEGGSELFRSWWDLERDHDSAEGRPD